MLFFLYTCNFKTETNRFMWVKQQTETPQSLWWGSLKLLSWVWTFSNLTGLNMLNQSCCQNHVIILFLWLKQCDAPNHTKTLNWGKIMFHQIDGSWRLVMERNTFCSHIELQNYLLSHLSLFQSLEIAHHSDNAILFIYSFIFKIWWLIFSIFSLLLLLQSTDALTCPCTHHLLHTHFCQCILLPTQSLPPHSSPLRKLLSSCFCVL